MPSRNRHAAPSLTNGNPVAGLRRALFLDRDGVINRRRLDHVKSWDEFEFLPGSLAALAALRRANQRVVVVTNQAAVGRGLLRKEELFEIHRLMSKAVSNAGGSIEAIYACTDTPESGCACRKPGVELFRRASSDLGISLEDSVMVGDTLSDVQAARAAGCRPILVGQDHGFDSALKVSVVPDLMSVVQLLNGPADQVA